MSIALPLLFLIFATTFGAIVAKPILLRFRSATLIVATAWFSGHYVSAFLVYYLSVVLVLVGQSEVLRKACIIFPAVVTLLTVLFCRRYVIQSLHDVFIEVRKSCTVGDVVACAVGLIFSLRFFLPQLFMDGDLIKTSEVYWDFPIHVPIIQGFVLGDNFPPQNSSLSGIPLTYHFFSDFLVSIYAALGLDLVLSMNGVTIVAFAFLLVTTYGLAVEFFRSRIAGYLAMALVITSGSLRFVFDIAKIWESSFRQWFSGMHGHPYFAAFSPNHTAGYNGNMFNMFYFLAERQMIPATIFLLISMAVLHYRRSFSVVLLLAIGAAAGAFIHWHLFVTISVAMMFGVTALIGSHRSTTWFIVSTMSLLMGAQVLEMRELTQSDLFFSGIRDYPKFNPLFPTMQTTDATDGYPLSVRNFMWYYAFAYGIKLLLIPLGLAYLWRRHRNLAIVFLALTVPTFLAVNTIQLSPLSIYDNHKWLRPLNVALDLLVAWTIATILLSRASVIRRTLGLCAIFLCTASGSIELLPYLAPVQGTGREKVYAPRHTPLTDLIERETPRQANFLSGNALEIHLAGRRTFLSNANDEPGAVGIVGSFQINEGARQLVRARIYNAPNRTELCNVAHLHSIDYVEQSQLAPKLRISLTHSDLPFISATNRAGHRISFLDMKALCRSPELFEPPAAEVREEIPLLSAEQRRVAIALSSLNPSLIKADFAQPQINRSFLNHPLYLAGKAYQVGLGLHAPTILTYEVPADVELFRAIVGVDDDVVDCNGHSIVFRIHDEAGQELFDSGLVVSPSEPKALSIYVKGKKKLTLTVSDSGDGIACDHVDLADAFFIRAAPSPKEIPESP